MVGVDMNKDVECTNESITAAIVRAALKSIPKNKGSGEVVSWWSDECKDAVRKRAFGLFQKMHNVQHLNYKMAPAVVRRTISKAKRDYWHKLCCSVGRSTPLENTFNDRS
uniref:Uncharacterized protein n=1 Tax=Anguilla anguilla TaxID=7936 RepID=A0A0E9WLL2_ANGAN